ncbi:MAG: hypothetical protein ACJATI_001196 [Halioglobus sp.]|jgi:hypothetical protein
MVESYISAYNNFDIAGMVENLDAKVVFENYSNGDITHNTNGLDEFENMAIAGLEYFSSRSQIVMSWDASENTILVDIKYTGGAKIDSPNGIIAGEEIELGGTSEFNFHNKNIIRIVDKS